MGMRFQARVLMMGTDTGLQKDYKNPGQMKPYWKVGMMQGISSKAFNVTQEDFDKLYDVAPGTSIDIICDFNEIDGKTYLKLEDYQIVNSVLKGATNPLKDKSA